MITCQRCGARSSAALCRTHESDLRRMLQELAGTVNPQTGRSAAGWIENLADASTGQVRMGGDGGRKTRGDDAPIRFNDKASQLLQQVQGSLARWVQDICESRGVTYEPVRFVRADFMGPLQLGVLRGLHYTGGGAGLALWLLVHADAILASEDAGMCFNEVHDLTEAIKRCIDRPEQLREVGCCMTLNDDGKECGRYLLAKREAIEVECPDCHTTWNVEKLTEKSLDRADHMSWTAEAIMTWVERGGLQLNERTWRHWRATGVVKPCLYQRANDRRRIGIHKQSPEDIPLYRLSDVRRAIATKGQRRERQNA